MTKKNLSPKRLTLSTQTVRHLADGDLVRAGGGWSTDRYTCTVRCPTWNC